MGKRGVRFARHESQQSSDSRRSLPKTGHCRFFTRARCLEFDLEHAQHGPHEAIELDSNAGRRVSSAKRVRDDLQTTHCFRTAADSLLRRLHAWRWRHHRNVEQARARHWTRQLEASSAFRCSESNDEQERDRDRDDQRPDQRVARRRSRGGIGGRHRRTALVSGGCV
jgi:hypothetical protein